jgi:hypothetical protein
MQHAAQWLRGRRRRHASNTHNARRGRAGPAAMGQQKRTVREQFFFVECIFAFRLYKQFLFFVVN